MPAAGLCAALALLAGFTLWCYAAGKYRLAATLLLPFFCLTGFLIGSIALAPPRAHDHIARLVTGGQQDLVISGMVTKTPETVENRTRLVLAVSSVRTPQGQQPTQGLVQLTVNGPLPAGLLPGDHLLARARVGPVRPARVPGAMDYRAFLSQQGIRASGWVASPVQIMPVPAAPASAGTRLRTLPERLRARANLFLANNVRAKHAPLYQALLTGTRTGVPPPVLEQFKASGAMHLLAISGMHLGLVTILFTALFTWLLSRSTRLLLLLPIRKTAVLLALLPLLGYAVITGLQPPAMRALIMALVFMAAILLDRQWCSLNTLAAAALAILLHDPAGLFSVSFQLSFAATGAILLALRSDLLSCGPPQEQLPGKLRVWLTTSLLISVIATLATAPLSLFYFNRLSLLSPLTTLVVAPLFCFWSIPLGLAGLALAPFSPLLASRMLTVGEWGLTAALAVVGWLTELPGAFFFLPTPSALETTAGLGALLCLLARPHRAGARKIATVLCCLLAISIANRHIARVTTTESRITFLDVGQGNATVLELPGGHVILLDGGGPATERFNVGEDLIAPFLWHRGIRRLDAVVVSHPHADHWSGVPFIIEQFRPATLWVNGVPGEEAGYQAMLARAAALGIPVKIPQPGEILARHGEATLRSLAAFHLPDAQDRGAAPAATPYPNNQSLVLHLRHGSGTCLLPGDLDAEHEEKLLATEAALTSTVLLAAHHGSRHSGSPRFIAAVKPQAIVVSAQGGTRARFPHPEKEQAWRELGIPVLVTGTIGSIGMSMGDGTVQIRPLMAEETAD